MFDTKTLNGSQSRVVMIPADKHILCVAGPGSGCVSEKCTGYERRREGCDES